MRQNLKQLYRNALAMMEVSKDAHIETLRRIKIGSSIGKEPVNPDLIAQTVRKRPIWGVKAFEHLYATGFIFTDWMEYFWYAPSPSTLSEEVTRLAGMEAIAIVRLSSMDCAPALPGINGRLQEFQEAAAEGDPIKTSLARQRLMLAIVGAIGPQRLAEDYVKTAKVATAYAVAATLDRKAIAGMRRSAENLLSCIGGDEARNCAAEAVAMRLHPWQPIYAEGVLERPSEMSR